MKDITIFENFINDEELEESRQFINKTVSKLNLFENGCNVTEWFFSESDNLDKKFIGGINDATPSVQKFITKIQNKIEKYTNEKVDIFRTYLNRQKYGQNGSLHTDDLRVGSYTLLIYIGDITPENYDKAGGDLEFKNKENTRIEPFTKRAVLFKGCIPHQACAPLVAGITRISFAFKLFCVSEKLPFTVKYN